MFEIQTTEGETVTRRDDLNDATRFLLHNAQRYSTGLRIVDRMGTVVATTTFVPDAA